MTAELPKLIHAAVGIIQRTDGYILFGLRPEGKPHAGYWEFPGGKVEPNETVFDALKRELHEELGIHVTQMRPWVTHIQHYPDRSVKLSFCIVTEWQGTPLGKEGQDLKWAKLAPTLSTQELGLVPEVSPLLAGTIPPLTWLQIPEFYAITSIHSPSLLPEFLCKAQHQFDQGLRLVQFREPDWSEGCDSPSALDALQQLVELAHQFHAKVLINSCHPQEWVKHADGLHLRSQDIATFNHSELMPNKWLAASTHNTLELQQARAKKANFAVLGHVLESSSHPNQSALGWEKFHDLNLSAGLPTFALGGLNRKDLKTAQAFGAHGIAGISQFWD